jgi:hypothetical protein
MRNMSFALTSEQILKRHKFVTRRLGWLFLKKGDLVQPVRKSMGLRKGEVLEKLGSPIKILDVRREPLNTLMDSVMYGLTECALEGFFEHKNLWIPPCFIEFFCESHRGCKPDTVVTRIEFRYTD